MSERLLPPPLPPRRPLSSSQQSFTTEPTTDTPLLNGSLSVPKEFSLPAETGDTRLSSSVEDDATLVAEAWRSKLENEEIERYLAHFKRHVDHVRVPTQARVVPIERPRIQDFSKTAKLHSTGRDESSKGSDADASPLAGQSDPAAGLSWLAALLDVDWTEYVSAYLRYLIGASTLRPPVEPFTIPRLRSSAERLYTVAIPFWERFGRSVSDVLLWRDQTRTALILSVYITLVFTSTLLPAMLLAPLYPLLQHKFFPPSAAQQYQEAVAARAQAEDLSDLTEVLIEDIALEGSIPQSGQGLGSFVDLSNPSEFLRANIGGGKAEIAIETAASAGKDKPRKNKDRIRRGLRTMELEYGPGAIVAVSDLADLHEKIKNLYLWRSPHAANIFIVALISMSIMAYKCPLRVLVILFELALGVVLFLVVPLVAAQERYEPMSWMAGSAPTDAEYAIELLKKRGLTGPPAPSRASSSTTTPKERVRDMSSRSSKWLETARQLTTGESQFKLSLATSAERTPSVKEGGDSAHTTPSPRSLRIALAQRDGERSSHVSTYLAQHGRSPGNLRVSPDGISFHPLIPIKIKVAPKPTVLDVHEPLVGSENRDDSAPAVVSETKDRAPGPSIVSNRDVNIRMADVVGIRKRDKSTLFVIISSGLEITCADGTSVVFPFVAERDRAFASIVAHSHRTFSVI